MDTGNGRHATPRARRESGRASRGGDGGRAARDDGARMGPFGPFVPAMGRIVLLHRRRGEGAAALDPGQLEAGLAAHPVGERPADWRAPAKERQGSRRPALLGLGNNALPFALIAWGQTHLPAGLASILNAATPLFAVLVAHVFTAEELSCFKIIGAVAGMAGVVWVIGPDVLSVRGGTDAWAEGAVLLAALSYAVTAVFARRVGGLASSPAISPQAKRRRARSISNRSRSSSTGRRRCRFRARRSSRRCWRSPRSARRSPMSSTSASFRARGRQRCRS